MTTAPQLSVIIPCFNEQERIGPTIARANAYLTARGGSFEIFAVDDGSTDSTRSRLEQVSRRMPAVTVLGYDGNKGKGFAVRHAVPRCRGATILYMDADLATPMEELPKLEAGLADHDIAIGSRALPSSQLEVRQPRYREYMGRTFNAMVQLLAVPGINDTQCGFKLLRRSCAQHLFPQLTADTYTFDVELLLLARAYGYRVTEIPVRWKHVANSRVHPVIDSTRMAVDLLRLRWRHRGTHKL